MNIQDAYNIKNLKIANVNMDTGKITYNYPLNKIKVFSEKIIDIKGFNYKQSVTPNHDVIIDGKKIKASELLNQDIREEQLRFYISENEEGIDLSAEMIEILISIVMDATIVDYRKYNPNSSKIRIQYHLKKERKINYITNLLNRSNIPYTLRYGKYDDVYICIYGEYGRMLYKLLDYKKELPYYFTQMNNEQFQALFYALSQTDGTLKNNILRWRTTSVNDMNIVQELCIKHNYDMCVKRIENASGYKKLNAKPQYICSIGQNKNLNKKVLIQEREYNNYAFCFTMPHGTLITRYEYNHCITGNCFDRLYKYPVKEWNGGKVHEIRPNVLHLMRGEVYTIEGKKFFAFGGASSHDISDGILNGDDPDWEHKARQLRAEGKHMYRVKGMSWWPEELPSEEEMRNGLENLKKHNNKVDFIITHSPYDSIMPQFFFRNRDYEKDVLTEYLQKIYETVDFKYWFFGHMHENRNFHWAKSICIYEQIIQIN